MTVACSSRGDSGSGSRRRRCRCHSGIACLLRRTRRGRRCVGRNVVKVKYWVEVEAAEKSSRMSYEADTRQQQKQQECYLLSLV